MTQQAGHEGGGFGDVHHRYVEQFLQSFATVLAVAGLDHGVEVTFVATTASITATAAR